MYSKQLEMRIWDSGQVRTAERIMNAVTAEIRGIGDSI